MGARERDAAEDGRVGGEVRRRGDTGVDYGKELKLGYIMYHI